MGGWRQGDVWRDKRKENIWKRESRGLRWEIMLVSCRTETRRTKERSTEILNWGRDSFVSFKYTDMRQIWHDGTHLCSEMRCIRVALRLFEGTIFHRQRADRQKHLTLWATNPPFSFFSLLPPFPTIHLAISITLWVPCACLSSPWFTTIFSEIHPSPGISLIHSTDWNTLLPLTLKSIQTSVQ